MHDRIRDARATLDAAAAEMSAFDAPFLLGRTGAMRDAEELAGGQRRYLRGARDFLAEYEAVVGRGLRA